MGQEIACQLRYQRKNFSGTAYLETDFLLFRGEARLKIPFRDLQSVTSRDGVLKLKFAGGEAALELGQAAEKWADKILHPPTRLDKLGLKPGLAIRLDGDFDSGFLDEMRTRNIAWSDGAAKPGANIVLYTTATAAGLKRVPKLASSMQPAGALWVIYPKGNAAIREIDVIQAGRTAGLKDVKVARFSDTHTALKFVIPRDAR